MSKVYDNSGSIGKNPRKEKDSHPDLKGKATIGGIGYWISGWLKEGENGKWYSLSFEPQDEKRSPKERFSLRQHDEDIPF